VSSPGVAFGLTSAINIYLTRNLTVLQVSCDCYKMKTFIGVIPVNVEVLSQTHHACILNLQVGIKVKLCAASNFRKWLFLKNVIDTLFVIAAMLRSRQQKQTH
jgi:hypothetical protein